MIKDLGKLKYFLGIEVIDVDNGVVLTQRKYCLDILSEYGLLACKPAAIPMLVNITEYQKLIGKLIYLTTTRPDISYTLHYLSQIMHSPLNSHLKTAIKVLKYLKGSSGKGVLISKAKSMSIEAFVDADWARCAITRKSDSGFLCLFFVAL